jgi:hypothetical protein
MYLTLSELQSVPSFHFPEVVIPLRKAMGVLSDIIHCPQCPKENFTAIQNIASIAALSKALVERFNKVLMVIDAEAERMEQSGEKKPYRIGDNNPNLHHLHTGTLDCPLGFNIEIGAQDWKRLAKTALRTEVYGNGSNPLPLLHLVKEAEDRQKRWHEGKGIDCAGREQMFGERTAEDTKKKCEALGADHIRLMIWPTLALSKRLMPLPAWTAAIKMLVPTDFVLLFSSLLASQCPTSTSAPIA